MSALALIPARYDSVRFPGKPLALILGRPMIEHVWRRAKNIPGVNDVIVATDSPLISQAVESFGGKFVMTGGHHKSGSDRLAEAADILRLPDDALILNVQGDQPALDERAAGLLVAEMANNPGIEMGTVAAPILNPAEIGDPNHVKVVLSEDGFALYFSRSPIPFSRSGEEIPVLKHLGLYAYRAGFLRDFVKWPQSDLERVESLEQLRALAKGRRIKVLVTKGDYPEVDVPGDLLKAEAALRQRGSQ
ncbi:MAG: 3-deoxy-manno-octulosonate cytidylyltransferase [Deltaproteobacteria bacterium]|jgi:3-deoxy-manno-octulosonate cytidylyltransferase (CMP-KDO synthetase)|nr:3-deoxy-manno-octulosonate cytidylyltransferase [Deltaproteobacteria bacterium]